MESSAIYDLEKELNVSWFICKFFLQYKWFISYKVQVKLIPQLYSSLLLSIESQHVFRKVIIWAFISIDSNGDSWQLCSQEVTQDESYWMFTIFIQSCSRVWMLLESMSTNICKEQCLAKTYSDTLKLCTCWTVILIKILNCMFYIKVIKPEHSRSYKRNNLILSEHDNIKKHISLIKMENYCHKCQ